MKRFLSTAAAGLLSFAALPHAAWAATGLDLIYDGIAAPNVRAAPTSAAFAAWCAGACVPTVQQPVQDMSTRQVRGTVHVWAKLPFEAGTLIPSSFCFSEYLLFDLADGEIHGHSGTRGTCGATMDPVMKPPKHTALGATVVIAGGGDGTLVAGTQRFARWVGGRFTDRVFVGFGAPTSGVGGIVYYDQLMFRIMAP